jgi:hypothetical protein
VRLIGSSSPGRINPNDYKIGVCCFYSRNASIRSKSKGWLARNHNNVSEWSDISNIFFVIWKSDQIIQDQTQLFYFVNIVSVCLLFNAKRAIFVAISWREQCTVRWLNDDTLNVLDQHAYLDFYSVGTPKLQSAGGYVAPFGHIILISSQPVFALTPYWCIYYTTRPWRLLICLRNVWRYPKGVIRSRKSKDRHYNGQKKKDKRTNNDLNP